jgi:CRP/FNR family transcriptional regulator
VLPQKKLELLVAEGVIRKYEKGQCITNAGDLWPYFFLLASGSIHALKYSLEGRSLVVTTFLPGDIFWGLAFFYEHMPMPVTLEATKTTKIYLWSIEQMHPILMENGQFSWELSRLMIGKMARASEILEEMAFQPVAGRLAKLLMENGPGTEQGVIQRSLTLDEMAARIGSTREMVCRFLHRFADEGIIDITRTEYKIVNPSRMEAMVQKNKV